MCNILVVASLNDYMYAFDTSTGNQLWSLNLLHCTGGTPFLNNTYNGFPGAAGLPYYGIVATPVIDTAPTDPTAFVTSACVNSGSANVIKWYVDAVDLTTGLSVGSTQISDANFQSSNQLSRAALLLTHPGGTGTYVYIAFGAGVSEIGADPTFSSGWQYSGVIFGYKYTYSSNTFTAIPTSTSPPFYTEGSTLGTFPSVYTNFDGDGFTLGGPAGGTGTGCCLPGGGCGTPTCSLGSNWAVNQGGIWMSSKGPSSVASGDVYFASGNGAFSCSGLGPDCKLSNNTVYNWGESAMQLPAGSSSTAMTPADFYAPYVENYTTNRPGGDSSAAGYETEELSRLDLDFGVCGEVIIPHSLVNPFAMTCDKSGYLYVQPTPESTGGSLGQFQQLDGGLTGGTYKGQPPFQISRHPKSTDSSPVCPKVSWQTSPTNTTGSLSGTICDEPHELAWFSTPVSGGGFADLMFVWPINEAVEVFKGMLTNTNKTYSFGTSPQFDPCLTAGNCTGTLPPFPAPNQASEGAPMALAVNTAPTPAVATLWAVVPTTSNLLGTLYGYTVTADNTSLSFGSLSRVWYWDSGTTTHPCSGNPSSIVDWWAPVHTEPTLADNQQGTSSTGAVYVPVMCAITNSSYNTSGCYDISKNHPSVTLLSGVLVFTTCP